MKIEGYFAEIKTANEAVEKLKGMGYKDAFVDMNSHYNEETNVKTNLPGTETSVSLSGLILKSGAHGISRDKAPLEAANPMVSGLGKFEEIADVNCKVVVEAQEKDADKIKQAIREMGGDLENPNFRKPKIESDQEIAINNSLHEAREFLDNQS